MFPNFYRFPHSFLMAYHSRFSLLLRACVFVLFLCGSTGLHAEKIMGTVHDPTGAVIPSAKVEITGDSLPQPEVITSDGIGRFVSPELASGSYLVRVTRDGFAPSE